MGCDIHAVVQLFENNKWKTIGSIFEEGRNYAIFGWLANVRNYSAVKPLSEPRGYPKDFEYEYDIDKHSASWFTLKELLDVNYDEIIENRRYTRREGPNCWNGGATCEIGQGKYESLRDFLGVWYFKELETLKGLDPQNTRIVFDFDN